ncbi:MAG: ribonuclease Z [Chloroflexota bacterium]|nr:MAG: ribonuclease Z [Chloroflexota bacterium]
MIDVCLVGTAGTVPLPGRALAAALIRVGGNMYLADCGEGTQVAMRAPGWGFGGLTAILLTHVHADHIAGLPGLLLTLGMSGRQDPLTVYGTRQTIDAARSLAVLVPGLPFEVRIQELNGGAAIDLASDLRLTTIDLDHRMPCLGYRFDLARRRRFDRSRAEARGIPIELWNSLQHGQSVSWPGGHAEPDDVLGPPRPGLSVAYVTDTRPTDAIVRFAEEADLLICEATFMAPDDHQRAVDHQHMHLDETCALAARARARRLWVTHISQAITDPAAYAPHAAEIFPATTIGYDGLTTRLDFADDDG